MVFSPDNFPIDVLKRRDQHRVLVCEIGMTRQLAQDLVKDQVQFHFGINFQFVLGDQAHVCFSCILQP